MYNFVFIYSNFLCSNIYFLYKLYKIINGELIIRCVQETRKDEARITRAYKNAFINPFKA